MAFCKMHSYINLFLPIFLLVAINWNVAAEHFEQPVDSSNQLHKKQSSIKNFLFHGSDAESSRKHTSHPESLTEDSPDATSSSNPSSPASPMSLTCSAQCPSCPSRPPPSKCPSPCPTFPPPTTCPSPCPNVPECPSLECPVQECPSPCAACPACPQCEKRIPPGYEFFPGLGYYRVDSVPTIWKEAKATCEREGAHLAILNSQEESDLLIALFKRDPDIGVVFHLGFHDLYVKDRWVTIFGQPLADTGFPNWSPGQPDNDVERCGSMFINGLLNDVECINPQPFVCELPI